LKIGPHLPKLLSNIKELGFWNTVYIIGYTAAVFFSSKENGEKKLLHDV